MDRNVDITISKWGDETFQGRYRHFLKLTDPTNCLKTSIQLEDARQIVKLYKEYGSIRDQLSELVSYFNSRYMLRSEGIMPGGGAEALWNAKYLYDSAFHPETGEKQNILGRMSFQVPGGMIITGILLAFYKSPLEIFLGQWLNQSFNALVNFTNRSGDKPLPTNVILFAYFTATSLATATSIGLNKGLAARAPPLINRFVPFIAVAVANMVNIPCMRSRELVDGVVIVDEDGNKLGNSVIAAKRSIASVTFSRICIAAPGMLMTPVIMEYLEKKPFMKGAGKMKSCGIQTLLVGMFLLGAVPFGCALFPQKQAIKVDDLEGDLKSKIKERDPSKMIVYYNKGL